MKANGEFRVVLYAEDYDATRVFYRNTLDLPIADEWDRPGGDRGTVFRAGVGQIEVLAPHVGAVGGRPGGVTVLIEVNNVDGWYARLRDEKHVPIVNELATHPWGHRSFQILDPNGLRISLFSVVPQGRA